MSWAVEAPGSVVAYTMTLRSRPTCSMAAGPTPSTTRATCESGTRRPSSARIW
jgi:hypothetical protein